MAYNRKIKVGSDVISSLKSMGMKEAVRYANSLSNTKGNAELLEGARRLYGSRVKTGTASTAATYKSADAARSAVTKKANTPKMVDGSKKPPLKSGKVTVKDTRPGATGSTTFKTSSVNATRKKTAATKVTAKDKKKVSTVASWRY